ncbi:glycosyltransferase family 2 protein [Granulosicoccaceae sp. 1_MG-2023]|nr:glycosyltransferase family 2 protein [Granulosicoccaceae sp. 1_MG-2023]
MKISLIFTTYNSPAWLENVLWGLLYQSDRNFEIIVADDGSGPATREVITRMQALSDIPIRHVWQADEGFQKCRILNKALLKASGDYVLMTDGDCIPRHDFVATHRRYARPGHYLSGGYCKLPLPVSRAISPDDIKSGRAFDPRWLCAQGMDRKKHRLKLQARGWQAVLLNNLTPTKRTWNGHNASCFLSDALAVNGFDERMQYGGQDCEFGERLRNAGLRARQIRYSAICVHLDHPRGYASDASREKNRKIREKTRREGIVQTPYGIRPLTPLSDGSLVTG